MDGFITSSFLYCVALHLLRLSVAVFLVEQCLHNAVDCFCTLDLNDVCFSAKYSFSQEGKGTDVWNVSLGQLNFVSLLTFTIIDGKYEHKKPES